MGIWAYLEYPSGDNELDVVLLGQAFEMDPKSDDGEDDKQDVHVQEELVESMSHHG